MARALCTRAIPDHECIHKLGERGAATLPQLVNTLRRYPGAMLSILTTGPPQWYTC